ncbi:hypothetical protein [Paenibacillus bovis]|uniref:hypothetical protein n=1 Tax=Paenibacillus bovis TaxID=1616788 RepID=UPI001314E059|nr:hypothetical protein [Paenibacillus bovis]
METIPDLNINPFYSKCKRFHYSGEKVFLLEKDGTVNDCFSKENPLLGRQGIRSIIAMKTYLLVIDFV